MELTQADRLLFDELIVSARKMATMAELAEDHMSEEFQSMIADPLRELNAVLDKCPQAESVWDGSLRDEDLDITYYEPREAPAKLSEIDRGVKILHRITGISRQSHSKATKEENEKVVRRALTQAVRDAWLKQQNV